MNPLLITLIVGACAAAVIFFVLCWLFPDWFDTWAGDEKESQ